MLLFLIHCLCFYLVSVIYLLLLFYSVFLSHPSLFCHSSIVYNGIPCWNISLTGFPRAYLFLLVSFFSNIILLVLSQINMLSWFFQYSSLSWRSCFILEFLTYTSILLSSHTQRDNTIPSKLAYRRSVYSHILREGFPWKQ